MHTVSHTPITFPIFSHETPGMAKTQVPSFIQIHYPSVSLGIKRHSLKWEGVFLWRMVAQQKSKLLSFTPTLPLFILNSQSLGIKKTSSLALLSFFPQSPLNEENTGVVRKAADFAKGLTPSHILREMKADRKLK